MSFSISHTPLDGLLIIKPLLHGDERGFFTEMYHQQRFEAAGLSDSFVQDNLSKSQKNVLRGLHFQYPPHPQAKLVTVLVGEVLDVVVDIRKGSKTYGEYFSLHLRGSEPTWFYVPFGFAHGYKVIEEGTIFYYKCTDYYHPELEGGLLWNDSSFNIPWEIDLPILSTKDTKYDNFEKFTSLF